MHYTCCAVSRALIINCSADVADIDVRNHMRNCVHSLAQLSLDIQ